MTPRLAALDRLACLVLALLLLAGGLVLLDWQAQVVRDWPAQVTSASIRGVLGRDWWPWAFTGGALVLALLALLWLLAHLPRRPARGIRTVESGPTGTARVDLSTLAAATADRLEALAPVSSARGVLRSSGRRGARQTVELRAAVTRRTDGRSVADAVRTTQQELLDALGDQAPGCRVLLGRPRRLSGRGAPPPRVH